MNLDDCVYFSSRINIANYEVLPVFSIINRGLNDRAQFYDVEFLFLFNGVNVSESIAFSGLSILEIAELYKYTYDVAKELGFRKFFIPFPVRLFQNAVDAEFFNDLSLKDIYIKLDYREFKSLAFDVGFSVFKNKKSNFNIVLVVNDFSDFDFECVSLDKVFAVKLSSECFGFYYCNSKRALSSYLNKVKSFIGFVVVDGVSNIDQLLFCRAKDVSVQGYFIDFLRRFS